jgi:hypothetical protein
MSVFLLTHKSLIYDGRKFCSCLVQLLNNLSETNKVNAVNAVHEI